MIQIKNRYTEAVIAEGETTRKAAERVKADLSGADLGGANLSGAILSVADLHGAYLRRLS